LIGPAWPYRGGIAHFLESLDAHLRQAGHLVSIVNFSRQYPGWLFPGTSQFDHDVDDNTEHQHPSSERLIDSMNPFSWGKAAKHILQQKVDVVIFSYWNPFFAPSFGHIARQLRRSGVKVLALLHNALPHERRPGDRSLGRYFFKHCQGFLVLSEQVQNDLEAMVQDVPIRRASHPVYEMFGECPDRNSARQKLGLSTDQPVLLFFGHVRPYKGLRILLEAMPSIASNFPDVRLLIAGEFYEQIESYERTIDELGLDEIVRVRPQYIPNHEVGLYFSACDLVVQPYLATTQSGVAQLAYHFCRPIIVTDVGELSHLVRDGETGYVVPPNDPEALASAVHQFFRDSRADDFARRITELKPLYSWKRLVESIESLLESLPR
jgi:glycosyltransferase involved in cell wall biosynthesis